MDTTYCSDHNKDCFLFFLSSGEPVSLSGELADEVSVKPFSLFHSSIQ